MNSMTFLYLIYLQKFIEVNKHSNKLAGVNQLGMSK